MKPLNLQLYNKPQSEAELSRENIHHFNYRLQKIPLIIKILQGVVISFGLAYFYYTHDFSSWSNRFVFLIGLIGDLYVILSALYAQHVSASAIAAVSPRYLYIGTIDAMWRINWNLLSLDFFSQKYNEYSGRIILQLAGQKIPLYLTGIGFEMEELDVFFASIGEMIRYHHPTEITSDNTPETEQVEKADSPEESETAEQS